MLCGRCFSDTENASVCIHCGFDLEADRARRNECSALPLMYLLKDRFILGEVLGAGGFGITYLAYDREYGKLLAVKEFYPEQLCRRDSTYSIRPTKSVSTYEKSVEMFYEEADTLFKLNTCPSVVKVECFFKCNNTAYLAMEYVRGESVKDYVVRSGGSIGYDEAKRIILQIALALSEVHSMGIVHSDISPSNILIEPNGDLKLIDFGASRSFIGKGHGGASNQYKPSYAPPEQYSDSDGKIGPWTDIYALACTFYRITTGVPVPSAKKRKDGTKVIEFTQFVPDVEACVQMALNKALELDYRKRYSDIDQFISDFTDYSNTQEKTSVNDHAGLFGKLKMALKERAARVPLVKSRKVGYVEVLEGLNAGKKLFLDNGKHYYIGRNIDMCDLVVSNDTLISRVHCVICYDAKENIINIFDKSSNGIRLDTGESLNGGKAIIQRDSIIYLAGGKVALKCCLAQE